MDDFGLEYQYLSCNINYADMDITSLNLISLSEK